MEASLAFDRSAGRGPVLKRSVFYGSYVSRTSAHVVNDSITYIGKESNRLEEVEEQGFLGPSDVYTEYTNPRRDEWATKILPRLRAMPLRELMECTGLPRSTLQAIRAGRRPHPKNTVILAKRLNY